MAKIFASSHFSIKRCKIQKLFLILKKKRAIEASATSELSLLIWIFTEMYILVASMGSHFLHSIIFTEALIILIAVMILIRVPAEKD